MILLKLESPPGSCFKPIFRHTGQSVDVIDETVTNNIRFQSEGPRIGLSSSKKFADCDFVHLLYADPLVIFALPYLVWSGCEPLPEEPNPHRVKLVHL